MRIVCTKTSSRDFNLKEVTTIFSNDFDYSFGGYGLELGKEYLVMGMLIYRDSKCLYYLIDLNGRTEWLPYLLFDISDHALPHGWTIKINNEDTSDVYFICGFPELCSEDFYNQLLDREENAICLYFNRKIEMEKQSDS